ncbi:hypothetical protein SAMN05660841_02635 [Sphingobacterium nematocida]|uniref:Uncharacterized protein n=1 Tax=Sphingobacterium nematocida TaxID=1513896 RepID=A0A1T5EJX5_9SPHI|nr:hypothetical protein [Sphingobacterium nematocida]SKB84206.1 hypothetical protein SAMN05660841_02635 [Sphingobacterium nematocida]
MNKIIKKISGAVQLVLMAPVKLPGQALLILKYVAIGLGIIEKVMEKTIDGDEEGDGGDRSELGEKGEGSEEGDRVNELTSEQGDGGRER